MPQNTLPQGATPPSHHAWIASLLGDVPEASAESILARLAPVQFRRGQHIFEAGAAANEIFFLAKGKVKLSRSFSPDDPRRESLLNVIGDGGVFGELSVLDPGPRTTTATALTNCDVYTLSRTDLDIVLEQHPELALGMLQRLAHRLRNATDYSSDLVLNDVHGRTARTILHLTHLFGQNTDHGIVVQHGLTQQEIAHMVGASRESVNKYLMELTENGWITLSYRAFVVLDPTPIERRADRLNPSPLPPD